MNSVDEKVKFRVITTAFGRIKRKYSRELRYYDQLLVGQK